MMTEDQKIVDGIKKRFNNEVNEWRNIYKSKASKSDIIAWEALRRKEYVKQELVEYFFSREISLLDIGCGTGNVLSEILEINDSWKGTGVDISNNMIEFCKENNENGVYRVLDINCEKLNDQFDVALLMGVVGYLDNNGRVFNNIETMLKKDGFIIFTYGKSGTLSRRIRSIYLSWPNIPVLSGIINAFRKILRGSEPVLKSAIKDFQLYTQDQLKRELDGKFSIIDTYNICYVAGTLGLLSVFFNRLLEKLFNGRDPLNLALTQIVIAQKVN